MSIDGFRTGSGANVGIKDTFIEVASINNTKFGMSIGAQPLLFGLKANGYPGDRTITPSLEFMSIFGQVGAGGTIASRSFAVSQQAGPSVKFTYNLDQKNRVVFGAFDTAERTSAARNSGSSVHQNLALYYKAEDFLGTAVQFFAGAMTRYIGKAVDGTTDIGVSRPIYDLGAGYSFGPFDLSLEAISVHKDFAGTTDDEMLLIAETEFHFDERNSVYLDYGSAQKLEIKTLRAGVKHQIDKPLLFQAEFSQDTFEKGMLTAAGAKSAVESFDVMLKYVF